MKNICYGKGSILAERERVREGESERGLLFCHRVYYKTNDE